MLALVDCNNFYASCERAFRPDLRGKPVVVLSNNDGCIIARSQEAKDLGYKMGDAFFKVKRRLQGDGVAVMSSQYALYGDMSHRVMSSLHEFTPRVDVYSIDEAFLDLSGFNDLPSYARQIKQSIEQWTGIPVSIGIAPTKTLAKVANRIAKKTPSLGGVLMLEPPYPLDDVEAGDIWGIGRRISKRLSQMGIDTVGQLARSDPRHIRKTFSVVVERTVRELQGLSCIAFDEAPPHPQNIMVSRGFKGRVRSLQHLSEAVAFYASRAAEKARGKQVFASQLTIFIQTSPFSDGPRYANSAAVSFEVPVNDNARLVKAARYGLRQIFKPGFEYQKAGIMLTGLVYETARQSTLFSHDDDSRQNNLTATLDRINARFGRETVRLASSGFDRPWWMARERLSPCYTTRWRDIPLIRV